MQLKNCRIQSSRIKTAVAETIENNVRKLITDEMPTNPKYYAQMSLLLAELVKKRKKDDIEYKKYLKEIIELTKKAKNPMTESVSPEINTKACALFMII